MADIISILLSQGVPTRAVGVRLGDKRKEEVFTATQETHDNFNVNANLQIDKTDIADSNKMPCSSYGSDGSGDRQLLTDTTGRLMVQVDDAVTIPVKGNGVENQAAPTSVLQVGGRYDFSARTLDNGDVGAVALDTSGRVLVAGAAAENATLVGNPIPVGGRYDFSARTLDDGDVGAVALDTSGRVLVAGAAAENATMVGIPIPVGGRYDFSARTLDDGDVGAVALDTSGRLVVSGTLVEGAAANTAPILIGGRYDITPRAIADQAGAAIALDLGGRVMVTGGAAEGTSINGNPVPAGGRYDVIPRSLADQDVATLAVSATGSLLTDASVQVAGQAVTVHRPVPVLALPYDMAPTPAYFNALVIPLTLKVTQSVPALLNDPAVALLGTDQVGMVTWPLFPNSVKTIQLRSSSANDTASGDGLRTVKVRYLDENWDYQTKTVVLNGLSAVYVPSVIDDIVRIISVDVATTGGNHVAGGGISIRSVDGTVLWTNILPIDSNRSNGLAFSVPNGFYGVVKRLYVSVEFGNDCIIAIKERKNADTAFYAENTVIQYLVGSAGLDVELGNSLIFEGKSDVWVEHTPNNTANNNSTLNITCFMTVVFVNDGSP
jgi:hypothetical protein